MKPLYFSVFFLKGGNNNFLLDFQFGENQNKNLSHFHIFQKSKSKTFSYFHIFQRKHFHDLPYINRHQAGAVAGEVGCHFLPAHVPSPGKMRERKKNMARMAVGRCGIVTRWKLTGNHGAWLLPHTLFCDESIRAIRDRVRGGFCCVCLFLNEFFGETKKDIRKDDDMMLFVFLMGCFQ